MRRFRKRLAASPSEAGRVGNGGVRPPPARQNVQAQGWMWYREAGLGPAGVRFLRERTGAPRSFVIDAGIRRARTARPGGWGCLAWAPLSYPGLGPRLAERPRSKGQGTRGAGLAVC